MIFKKLSVKFDDAEEWIMTKLIPSKPFALTWKGWPGYYAQLNIFNPFTYILYKIFKFLSKKLYFLTTIENSIICSIRPRNVIKLKTLSKYGGNPHEIILHCAFENAKKHSDAIEMNFDGYDLSDPNVVKYIEEVERLKKLIEWWDERVKNDDDEYQVDSQKLTELMGLTHLMW